MLHKLFDSQDNSNLHTDNIFIFACIYLFSISRFPNIFTIPMKIARKGIGTPCFGMVVKNSVCGRLRKPAVVCSLSLGVAFCLSLPILCFFSSFLFSLMVCQFLLLNTSSHSTVNNCSLNEN